MSNGIVDPAEGLPFPDQQTSEMTALYEQQLNQDVADEVFVQAEFALSRQEVNSPTMKKLVGYFEERLSSLRMQNDNPITELDTSLIRGKIALVKEFLELGKIQDSDSDSDDHEEMHQY